MNAANPWFILRNYLAQEAIEAAEQGDMKGVERLLDASRRPYTVDSDRPELGGKRPDWARNKPGCSALVLHSRVAIQDLSRTPWVAFDRLEHVCLPRDRPPAR